MNPRPHAISNRNHANSDRRLILGLGLLCVLCCVLSLLTVRHGGFAWPGLDWQSRLILFEIRLPRTLLAAVSGAVLALAGAVMQGWLRNPLADSGVLGFSSSAALFAVGVLYFLPTALVWAAPLAAICGALGGFLMLLMLNRQHQGITSILLAGTAINAFCGAMIALLLNLAPNPFAMQDLVFWMMGSFENRSFEHLALMLPAALIGAAILWRAGRALDVLALGPETALSLGISPHRLFWMIGLGTALTVGSSVAVSGVIGFVGLVVPHLIRPLVQWEPRRVLLPSALAGAALVTLADIVIRQLPPGPELRIGVLTALVGGPFFLYLLQHLQRADVEP